MTKRMLIDATHKEETRVAVVSDDNRLEDFDYESAVFKQLKGNIYLVKVTRVEPSLQAAFVDFGGNRHGFLPFPEIHPDYYRIPVEDRQALLEEERRLGQEHAAEAEALADAEAEEKERKQKKKRGRRKKKDEEVAEEEVIEADVEETEDDEDDKDVAVVGGADAEVEVEDNVVRPAQMKVNVKRRYKIQEVIKRGQVMLIQINKEERGNKGAAVSSYISLPGRYCVLMPNSSRGGGVSRKVSNMKDRKRLKKILADIDVPEGMSAILRTAGVERSKAEIKRDLDYLLRLWNDIRELTLQSTAPALVHEEGNLIKRAIRDLYKRDIEEILVAGEEGHQTAKKFMKTLIPSHARRVKLDKEDTPLFARYNVERQIDETYGTTVRLRSGGYLVINPTEALVSIDINSGKATKGRHIEETAVKTNIEAAEEIARQLRLRDLGGLVVIDFIDMEENKNNRIVERKLREAMQGDRARIQISRISVFGLLELSRQRLRPSLVESNFSTCPHCAGNAVVRTVESASVMILRHIEEELLRGKGNDLVVTVSSDVALYLLNKKRDRLQELESTYNLKIDIEVKPAVNNEDFTLEYISQAGKRVTIQIAQGPVHVDSGSDDQRQGKGRKNNRNRRNRRRRNNNKDNAEAQDNKNAVSKEQKSDDAESQDQTDNVSEEKSEGGEKNEKKRTRRGRRSLKKPEDKKQDDAVDNKTDDKPEEKEKKKPAAKDSKKDADEKPEKEEKKPAAKKKRAPRKKAEAKPADDKPVEEKAAKKKSEEPKPEKSKVVELDVAEPEKDDKPPAEKKKGWWQNLKK